VNQGIQYLCATALAIVLSAVPTSCTAGRVKPQVLFPPAQLTWPAIEEDLHRGIDDGVDDGDLTTESSDALRAEGTRLGFALTGRDLEGVRTIPWNALEPWAERGIDDKLSDGEIGPGVATSLREQLSNFTETIERLQETY